MAQAGRARPTVHKRTQSSSCSANQDRPPADAHSPAFWGSSTLAQAAGSWCLGMLNSHKGQSGPISRHSPHSLASGPSERTSPRWFGLKVAGKDNSWGFRALSIEFIAWSLMYHTLLIK